MRPCRPAPPPNQYLKRKKWFDRAAGCGQYDMGDIGMFVIDDDFCDPFAQFIQLLFQGLACFVLPKF